MISQAGAVQQTGLQPYCPSISSPGWQHQVLLWVLLGKHTLAHILCLWPPAVRPMPCSRHARCL